MGDQDQVVRYRGCLALRFAADSCVKKEIRAMLMQHVVDSANEEDQSRFTLLPEDEWHMTLVTKEELRGLSSSARHEAIETLSTRFFTVGLGGGRGVATDFKAGAVIFVVCVWPKAQAFRTKYGLSLKDFHVSVSTTNRHDIDKTSDALVDRTCLEFLSKPALEALSRQLMMEHKPNRVLEIARILCSKFGEETTRGWVRLADSALLGSRPKLAMLTYGFLVGRMVGQSPTEDGNGRGSVLWKHCLLQLSKCAEATEWGPVYVDGEIEQVFPELRGFLCRPWSISTWVTIRENVTVNWTPHSCPSRERLTTPYTPIGGVVEELHFRDSCDGLFHSNWRRCLRQEIEKTFAVFAIHCIFDMLSH